jgi:hypothetical protein
MDSIASDTDAFLDLPPPPTHEPSLGPGGAAASALQPQAPAVAASLGPRFYVGCKVVVLLPGGRLERGTVGQVVSVAPPDPRYKVAFKEAILEVADSQCAADLVPGARVEVVEGPGGLPQGATVLDCRLDKWWVAQQWGCLGKEVFLSAQHNKTCQHAECAPPRGALAHLSLQPVNN